MNQFNNQPQQFQMGQTGNRQQEILTIDLVSGEPAVYSFYVAPGVTAFLIDFTNKKFYIKAVDFRGVPQQLRIFSFEELIQTQQQTNNDTEALQSQIDELKSIILSMSQNNQQSQPKEQKRGNNR